MKELTTIAPFVGLFGMIVAYVIYLSIKRQTDGNEVMRQIALQIHEGAMAFL
jgi:K(+)-stimulated pyrophosphate-energized sodium pump